MKSGTASCRVHFMAKSMWTQVYFWCEAVDHGWGLGPVVSVKFKNAIDSNSPCVLSVIHNIWRRVVVMGYC